MYRRTATIVRPFCFTAAAKGKKEYDKRQTIKEKDIRREMERE